MRIKQKLLLWAPIAVFALAPLFLLVGRAYAASVNKDDFKSPPAVYTITSIDPNSKNPVNINAVIANQPGIVFTDKDPSDDKLNFLTDDNASGFICPQARAQGMGITLNSPATQPSAGVFVYTGKITVNYSDDTTKNKCADGTYKLAFEVPIEARYDSNANNTGGSTCTNGFQNPPACDKCSDGSNTTPCPGATGTGTTATTCESSSNTSLEWFICPLFNIATDLANSLLTQFQSQLCFKVQTSDKNDPSQTVPYANCGNKTFNTDSVKPVWNATKNIVSAMLVIIMLIAVFSQAISIGPIDAYTIRKLLPRLVAAVILIQISFYLFSWIVNVVDDIGEGLQSLVTLVLPSGINNFNTQLTQAGVTQGTAATVNWVGLIATVGLTAAALPTVLLAAFTIVLALLIGLAVLIFRKVLIIMLILLAPLALLLWILPGTEKFFKMWWDNFLKLLFMFPLIVLLIEAGRIFAWVAGQAAGKQLMAMFLVIVGFFGPLFILPRTFKWGGALMSSAGDLATRTTQRIGGKEGALGKEVNAFARRTVTDRFAKRYNPNAGILRRTGTSIMAGRLIPTRYQKAVMAQRGDKWGEERDAEALAIIKRRGEIAMKNGYDTAIRDEEGNALSETRIRRNAAGQYLDKHNNVTSNIDEAREIATTASDVAMKPLKGVAAMKQMWVDLAEEGDNDRERKMAIRQLTATSSWPEVQDSFTKSGKRVIDTADWSSSVTTSPEDYPRVLRSRVDAAPHIVDSANKKAATRSFANDKEEQNYKSSVRILASIEGQMSNEDFATQSDGYWKEAARMANLTDSAGVLTHEATEIRRVLNDRFKAIQGAGPTARQQMLGHLVNGGDLERNVNRALGLGPGVNGQVGGHANPQSVQDYMQ